MVVRRPSGCLGIDTAEPKLRKIKSTNKDVDRMNRIILANPIFQAFREQRALPAIHPLNKAPHLILPRISSRESHTEAFSHSQGHLAALPLCSIAVRFTPVSGIDSRSQALPSRSITGREHTQQR